MDAWTNLVVITAKCFETSFLETIYASKQYIMINISSSKHQIFQTTNESYQTINQAISDQQWNSNIRSAKNGGSEQQTTYDFVI